jgi:hypothetical protein
MGNAILVNYRVKPNERLYLAKVLNGFMNLKPVKLSIYANYVHFKHFRWRIRHNTLAMSLHVVDHLNNIEVAYDARAYLVRFLPWQFQPV